MFLSTPSLDVSLEVNVLYRPIQCGSSSISHIFEQDKKDPLNYYFYFVKVLVGEAFNIAKCTRLN